MQIRKQRVALVRLFVLISVVSFQLFAQGTKPESPEDVVKRYCDLDFEGARLTSQGYSKISGLYSWPDEPGWDRVTVIKRFLIKGAKRIDTRHAAVSVEYLQAGELGGSTFVNSEKVDNVQFRLIKKDKDWVITAPVIQPHISAIAAEHHIEGLIHDEGEESRAKWAKALTELKSLETTNRQ